MSTVYGVNYTDIYQSDPSQKGDVGDIGGRVRILYDKYTASGALSSGTIIKMGKLPKGVRVVGWTLKHDDLGATGSCNVGWAAGANGDENADPNGFLDSVDLNSAANVLDETTDAAPAGLFKEFTEEVDVQIALSANTTAGGDLELAIFYVMD